MPIKPCTVNGGPGYKWGDSGKCYRNRKDAEKQGAAIEIQKHKAGASIDFTDLTGLTTTDIFDICIDCETTVGERWAIIKQFEDFKHGK